MFGYVVASQEELTQQQRLRYQGCYCGLCRCIGEHYGTLPRMALNYDMTFLVLLLSSLYEPEEHHGQRPCLPHPLAKHTYWDTEASRYAAAMNMALAYHNCMDDWHDDRHFSSLLQSRVFRRASMEAAAAYPAQNRAMITCMDCLRTLEQTNQQDPDAGANAFGQLMGQLFVWQEDRWAPLLRQMGASLGRFIYLMDAVLDLPEDQKRGRYNPLTSRNPAPEEFYPVLRLLIGECTDAFERLPLVQDVELMRNILYSGVWTRFRQVQQKAGKEEVHV